VQELKGFQRIYLALGESKQVAFPLGFDELSFYDVKMRRVVKAGTLRGDGRRQLRQREEVNSTSSPADLPSFVQRRPGG
jgi:hypothetical protein